MCPPPYVQVPAVDEGVEGLVREHAPRQVRDALELVVDEKLRRCRRDAGEAHGEGAGEGAGETYLERHEYLPY